MRPQRTRCLAPRAAPPARPASFGRPAAAASAGSRAKLPLGLRLSAPPLSDRSEALEILSLLSAVPAEAAALAQRSAALASRSADGYNSPADSADHIPEGVPAPRSIYTELTEPEPEPDEAPVPSAYTAEGGWSDDAYAIPAGFEDVAKAAAERMDAMVTAEQEAPRPSAYTPEGGCAIRPAPPPPPPPTPFLQFAQPRSLAPWVFALPFGESPSRLQLGPVRRHNHPVLLRRQLTQAADPWQVE